MSLAGGAGLERILLGWNSRFASGMTDRKARAKAGTNATARARAKTGVLLWIPTSQNRDVDGIRSKASAEIR
jgi:hypothetical protein